MNFIIKRPKLFFAFALIALCILGIIGNNFYNNNAVASQAEKNENQPEAMAVPVSIIEPIKAQLWYSFSARMEAVEFAEIRPQISGRITEIRFQDGAMVTKGDVLYVIDPRPYVAALNEAKASLSSAKTEASLAQKELNRAKGLIKTNAISQRVLDERKSRVDAARAVIDRAESLREQAEINLDYAYVKAPISGRVGRAEIKVGNVVDANAAMLLTSIVATDRIYADFEVDEQTYLGLIQSIARSDEKKPIPVKLYLNGVQELAYDGVVDSFDNRIDVSNGTIRARAIFDNADGILIPGMFANIKVGSPNQESFIMVDEKAIGTDQDRKFVYIVDDNNVVQYREITTGESQKGKRIVKKGLHVGDKVVTAGLLKIRPNMPVSPQAQPVSQ